MIPNPCIEAQTLPEDRPSVPPWFAEVVIIAQHLATNGLLDVFAHQVRLVRGRFGSYEPIDFLAVLVGYTISGELTSALQAITTYLKQFAFSSGMALVRLDGQYGDASVVAQIMLASVYVVTRGRGYQLLEHPQIQGVLAHPPTARVSRMNTGEVVELFDGGWLPLGEGLPHVRVIVARHPALPAGKPVTVDKRIDEWVYELFLTNLDADGFLAEGVLDLYHGRGAFEAVLTDEDVEMDPDRWCSYTECGQELWQIACQWVWNLRLTLGHAMQGGELREIEGAPPKEAPPVLVTAENPPEEYGPWQWATAFGRATGRFGADAFVLQENGTLRCPAGASLWLSEVRQENAFTQRAVSPFLPDRLSALFSS